MDAIITSSSSSLAGNIKQESNSSSCQDEVQSSGGTVSTTLPISTMQGRSPQFNIAANKLKAMMENKIKLENGESVSELLGSVIMDSCHGVRTSARVIQKMKENSARPTTPPLSERETKAKEEKTLQKTPSQTKPNKVVWSNLERNFFFDAINEFGKDFEAITNYINMKLKRKCPTDQCFKTKEQIRTLYYQTFHKLSKYIKFSDDVKKPVQELYALINYGEMRRKLQFVSEKNYMKIKDLVYKGYAIARSKGKNIRIKTPSCKALRRLNQLEDWLEDIKLPPKVEVQLRPATMSSFLQVQGVAQNPLVRTSVPLQKKLINIIKTFQNKWRTKETKLLIEATKLQQQSINLPNIFANKAPTHNIDTNFLSINDSNCLNLNISEPFICLRPTAEAVIHRPLLSITEVLSSFNVCLNSYEERIGAKVRGEILCNEKSHLKRHRSESNCEKRSPEMKKLKQNELNINVAENTIQKQNMTHIKTDVKTETNINLQNLNTSVKDELKPISSGDELEENNLQEDFGELLCDSNDDSDVKFSRQDSNSDIECHTSTLLTNSHENLSTSVNNIDKTLSSTSSLNAVSHNMNCSLTVPTNDSNFNSNNNNSVNSSNSSNNNSTHHNNSQSSNKIKKSKKKDSSISKKDMSNVRPLVNEEIIRRVRKGWTISNANDITVGDLYIVFGSDSKLIFEYYWTNENFDNKPNANSSTIVNHQSDETIFSTGIVSYNGASFVNNTPEEHEQQLKAINKIHSSGLSDKLKQLLVIANLSERMKKKSCYCGHTCDKFSKVRLENELVNRSVLNKNNMISNNETKSNSVFRQPLVPYRKSVFSIDAYRSRQSKMVRGGSVLKSQHLFVQRVLPVQPGVSPRYDILKMNTVEEGLKQKNIKPLPESNCVGEKFSQVTQNKNTEKCENINNSFPTKILQIPPDHSNVTNKLTSPLQQSKDKIDETTRNKFDSNDSENDLKDFKITEICDSEDKLIKGDTNLSIGSMPDLSPIMELTLPSPIHTPKYLEENTNDVQNFISIPPMSPASLLREVNSSDSSKWLEENINDYSLSSLLGHLDEINNGRDITSIDRSNISSNLSVISESSVDYVTKFAEIAASMQNEEKDL
ncbi:protein cramped-like [Condylostylus longicornis]|uniref:protein cramped-like n=1 Tax=Condylostylus longicornis TaxID=2530218 RepID=UPI00244DBC39|nr:protein cramped-like [Condylostylus longicornis]